MTCFYVFMFQNMCVRVGSIVDWTYAEINIHIIIVIKTAELKGYNIHSYQTVIPWTTTKLIIPII